ncbi:hypothetical protein Vretimale_6596 [Volvox reticuliferus]|uniref:Uncharacterized protein n=1 Tax=Volvox reticuliferus TaxID=1737510 RepID=A0A8J4CD67_9CHLO|nr:hypothetical protein Vretifemale_7338 [Volvox reticuliferus]GIM01814.1 hypothetical protein Vretimale_6596 [Volvox reticuliferus]
MKAVRFFFGAFGSLAFFSFFGLPPSSAAFLPLPFGAGSALALGAVAAFSALGAFLGRSASSFPSSFRFALVLGASPPAAFFVSFALLSPAILATTKMIR